MRPWHGPHLAAFGTGLLAYGAFSPSGQRAVETALLASPLAVSTRESSLEEDRVADRIRRADPVVEFPLTKNGHPAGSIHGRWVYDYDGP